MSLFCRRPPLSLLAALLATVLPIAAIGGQNPEATGQMTRKDRLAVLYSNQVIFDRKGEPLVSIRVTEGQETVRFSSKKPLTLLPSADDGARIRAPASARFVVTVEESKLGTVRHWVVAERLPAGELSRAAVVRKRWQDAGHEVKIFEGGALIGIAGRTLDTRSLTVAIDPQATAAEAEAGVALLSAKGPLLGEVISEPVERPTGWIVAREERSGLEIRARDILWLTPTDKATVDFEAVEFGRGTSHHGTADRRYLGDAYLAIGNDGRLAVVNVANAETLLEGIVPAEIPAGSPEAALAAQAVAARGQLLAKVGTRHRSDPYLLCADTHCQVYGGETKEHPRTTAAVRQTRGQLLFDDRGLVDTVYSSNCGGHSEAFDRYWGGSPNPTLSGVAETPEGPSPVGPDETGVAHFIDHPPKGASCAPSGSRSGVFRWTATRSGADVTRAVNQRAPIGDVIAIRVVERGRSGRALIIEYEGLGGKHVIRGEYANRQLLGHLKSGRFIVTGDGVPGRAPSTFTFRGGGFGHGVGMCQHGSIGRAATGKTHEEILRHYYPSSRLEKAW